MSLSDKIDIVVVNNNNNGKIQECVKSIKQYTDNYKLIVVDTASYDGSKEWLSESNISQHLILNKAKVNLARARNQALKVGNSDWVALISVDMIINDRLWLDKMWNYTIDRNIGLIEAGVKFRATTSVIEKQKFAKLDFCMIRRECLNDVGKFDERVFDSQDVDWLIKLEWSNWRTAYCYDANILSRTQIDRKEVFGNSMINDKYNQSFIQKTLRENSERRNTKEIQLFNQEG